jgi:hypothetical protein
MSPSKRVYWAIVQFNDGTSFKRRPVLVVNEFDTSLEVFGITSKYENKSAFIQRQYVEIKDWQSVPLPKRSWIDVGSVVVLPKNQYTIAFAGVVSDRDYDNLVTALAQLQQE